VLSKVLEVFDAPGQAGGPGFSGGETQAPDGKDLGALVDAFETFFGFGDGLDGRNVEALGVGSREGNAHLLPAIFNAEDRAGKLAAEAQGFFAGV